MNVAANLISIAAAARRFGAAGLLALLLGVSSAAAQGVAQVSLNGIPPVLGSPQVAELAVGFEQGQYPLTMIVTTPDRQSIQFTLRFLLEREGEVVLDIESDPVAYERGVYVYTSFDQEPPITFPVSYRELVDAMTGSLGQNVSRTGLLSEGMYTLTVEARATDPARLVLSVPSVSTFFVQYLEPPILVSPSRDEVVESSLPVFTWMPVIGASPSASFDYEFLLVEVYPGQEPQQAIESNRPIERLELSAITSLPYTHDRLALEPGRTYAWQVTAFDAEGRLPFTDGGRSEIGTFVFGETNPRLARWVYPYSIPEVTFNLTGANLHRSGYYIHGTVEGQTGEAPVGAFFENVTLDPVTLEVLEGSVQILGPLAENAGAVESKALRHVLSDETGPSRPSLTVRQSSSRQQARLNVVVGPSSDPESGISSVAIRLSSSAVETATGGPAESVNTWRTVFSSRGPNLNSFAGASRRISIPESQRDALALGWLQVQVRVTNGLGLHTFVTEEIGSPTDLSPPLLSIGAINYLGYYDVDRPNQVLLKDVVASDEESGIVRLRYRIAGDSLGGWTILAEPGTNRYSEDELFIPIPEVTRDSTVILEISSVNRAGLRTSWTSPVAVDIDTTPPVQVADLGAFVESDTDPRIELAAAAAWDAESGVTTLSYRVVDDNRTSNVYVDWTPFPSSGLAEIKRTQLNFANRRDVRIDVRATNGAGLSDTFSQTISVPALTIADLSPPSTPDLSITLVGDASVDRNARLEIRLGRSVDRESGISRVLYRVENPADGAAIVAWRQVDGVVGGTFDGAVESVDVTVPENVSSLRVVVRVANGAARTTTASETVAIGTQDLSPPEIRDIQAYAQDDRLLIFIDGLADPESFIDKVEYRVLGFDGSILVDWTDFPVVRSRRPSYGRQLLRAALPDGAAGTEIVLQLRVFNGAGQSTEREKRVQLSR